MYFFLQGFQFMYYICYKLTTWLNHKVKPKSKIKKWPTKT
jgi:hypothetical protein